MNAKIVAIAIGVAGVLLAAGVLMAVWPAQQPDAREESKFILPEQETVRVGADDVISGQLSDDGGRALASEAVSISSTLPDGSSGGTSTVYTNDRGEFSFAVAPTKPGEHKVTVTYGGSAECKPSTFIIIVVVIDDDDDQDHDHDDVISTALTMSGPDTVKVNTAARITGQLKAEDGAGIGGASISIQVTNPDGSKRSSSSVTTATDGKFAVSITPTKEGEHTVIASYSGNVIYGKSSSTFGFDAEKGDGTTPPPIEKEPKLWMEYTTSWNGDSIQYGMPSPWSNQFTIETNKYGEDQPSGPVRITHFIHISNVEPRSGVTGPAEGSCEIRTYNPNSQVSRLVNLFDDGKGGAYGILVDTYSTWDYTWTFENGKSEKFTQTFSINITKLGSHEIDVYAVHDHGDGTAVEVSNHLTRSFTTNAREVISGGYAYVGYDPGVESSFRVTVAKNTYTSNIHGQLPYVYTNDVQIKMFLAGTSGYTLKLNGQAFTGVSTTYNGVVGTMYDLGTWNAGSTTNPSYDFAITVNDGNSHSGSVIVTDVPSGEVVGSGYVSIYENYRC